MNPGTGGDSLNRNQLNPQSGYQQMRDITSPVELSECRSQLLLRRARNAERMRRWRQSRQANETLQQAASRRAQHAEEVRKWRRSRGTNEMPLVAAAQRGHHTAQVRTQRAARHHFIPLTKHSLNIKWLFSNNINILGLSVKSHELLLSNIIHI